MASRVRCGKSHCAPLIDPAGRRWVVLSRGDRPSDRFSDPSGAGLTTPPRLARTAPCSISRWGQAGPPGESAPPGLGAVGASTGWPGKAPGRTKIWWQHFPVWVGWLREITMPPPGVRGRVGARPLVGTSPAPGPSATPRRSGCRVSLERRAKPLSELTISTHRCWGGPLAGLVGCCGHRRA